MTTPPRGFDTAEFAARCAHAQAAMAQADGALLLTSEAEIRYFTGFMTQFWQALPGHGLLSYRHLASPWLSSHRLAPH